MQKVKIAMLIFLTFSGIAYAEPDDGKNIKWFTDYQEMFSGEVTPKIWWLRPVNPEWTIFEGIQILDENLISILKSGKYDKSAGNYNLMDVRYERAEKSGQGIIVIDNGKNTIGFQFMANMVNRNTLGRIHIKNFDLQNKVISYFFDGTFAGLVFDENFRTFLLDIKIKNNENPKKLFIIRTDERIK